MIGLSGSEAGTLKDSPVFPSQPPGTLEAGRFFLPRPSEALCGTVLQYECGAKGVQTRLMKQLGLDIIYIYTCIIVSYDTICYIIIVIIISNQIMSNCIVLYHNSILFSIVDIIFYILNIFLYCNIFFCII